MVWFMLTLGTYLNILSMGVIGASGASLMCGAITLQPFVILTGRIARNREGREALICFSLREH